MAIVQRTGDNAYSHGISYHSSPVEGEDRTIDQPFDETAKLSAAWVWGETTQLWTGRNTGLYWLFAAKTVKMSKFQDHQTTISKESLMSDIGKTGLRFQPVNWHYCQG